MGKFPKIVYQSSAKDCGGACLTMIADYYGLPLKLHQLADLLIPDKEGVTMAQIAHAATALGLKAHGYRLDFRQLQEACDEPCIAHWDNNHFVVVAGSRGNHFIVLDPALGKVRYSRAEFQKHWGESSGTVLFFEKEREVDPNCFVINSSITGFPHIISLLRSHASLWGATLACLLGVAAADMLIPLLTRTLYDRGIGGGDAALIYLMLAAQLALTIGKAVTTNVEGFLALKMGNNLMSSLVGDMLRKFYRLRKSFFDSKSAGEILQSTSDIDRVEQFITTQLPTALVCGVSLVISASMLIYFDWTIFIIAAVAGMLYFIYSNLWTDAIRKADYQVFRALGDVQTQILEYVKGISEIKLYGAYTTRSQKWKSARMDYYDATRKAFVTDARQSLGIDILGTLTEIVTLLVTALAVARGGMTMGTMLAICYVVGSFNHPVMSLTRFSRQLLNFTTGRYRLDSLLRHPEEGGGDVLPDSTAIKIEDVTFSYSSPGGRNVLEGINLIIPAGATVAIVGESGSGKSTLLKLITGLYSPTSGRIVIGSTPLNALSLEKWRSECAVVACDGYIFDDTLSANIAVADDTPDHSRLLDAVKLARLEEIVDCSPTGLDTQIGSGGMRLSAGQRQRVLLARAFYTSPGVLLLDEATNALDSVTESMIYDNIRTSFSTATVIITAHRLSTIENADTIVVMDNGRIVAQGSHRELLSTSPVYRRLIDAQCNKT